MESKSKMPKINQDYPESDVSDNQRLENESGKKDSTENKNDEVKGSGADIENLPEVKPARVGILG